MAAHSQERLDGLRLSSFSHKTRQTSTNKQKQEVWRSIWTPCAGEKLELPPVLSKKLQFCLLVLTMSVFTADKAECKQTETQEGSCLTQECDVWFFCVGRWWRWRSCAVLRPDPPHLNTPAAENWSDWENFCTEEREQIHAGHSNTCFFMYSQKKQHLQQDQSFRKSIMLL